MFIFGGKPFPTLPHNTDDVKAAEVIVVLVTFNLLSLKWSMLIEVVSNYIEKFSNCVLSIS